MRLGGGLSKFLSAGLIPLCIWGMVSALCLFLIDLRSAIILGGENRLRLGVLGFAAGAVLVQRLFYQEGRSSATRYAVIFLALITVFSLQSAFAYRVPIHPLIVFVANCAVLYALWFAGRAITKGCSADEESAMAAADSGSLRKMARWKRAGRKPPPDELAARDAELERKWAERLPKKHPGASLLYFSVFAIPVFGLGLFFFNPEEDPWARARLGGYLFVYLFCCMSLLFLASLAQLRAYFETREVTLPEPLGLAWMAIGFAVVTVVMVAAFLAPQPESMASGYIRERIISVYKGPEADWGFSEWLGGKGKKPGKRKGGGGKEDGGGGTSGEKLEGVNEVYANPDKDLAAANEVFRKAIDKIVRVVLIVGGVALLISLCAIIAAIWKGFSEGLAGARRLREKKKGPKPAGKEAPALLARFGRFSNPFAGGSPARDGNALVRYLWEAMLALCADAGSPCGADQTPFEFVDSKPAPLKGFEKPAQLIADFFTFSEFSGEQLPTEALPKLRQFWEDLERQASRVGL